MDSKKTDRFFPGLFFLIMRPAFAFFPGSPCNIFRQAPAGSGTAEPQITTTDNAGNTTITTAKPLRVLGKAVLVFIRLHLIKHSPSAKFAPGQVN